MQIELPERLVRMYQSLYRLEIVLRALVQVELTSSDADWETTLKKANKARSRDYEATHMEPPSDSGFDYLMLGELKDIILDESRWDLFSYAMPPKPNAEVTLELLRILRNRVAHFRDAYPDDEQRLLVALADLDPGLCRFADRYSRDAGIDVESDAVFKELEARWDSLGWKVEMAVGNQWLYAAGESRSRPQIASRLSSLRRPASHGVVAAGEIYMLELIDNSGSDRRFDLDQFMLRMGDYGTYCIHICPSLDGDRITLTVPALIGSDKTVNTLAAAIDAAKNSYGSPVTLNIEKLKNRWKSRLRWPGDVAHTLLAGNDLSGSLIR